MGIRGALPFHGTRRHFSRRQCTSPMYYSDPQIMYNIITFMSLSLSILRTKDSVMCFFLWGTWSLPRRNPMAPLLVRRMLEHTSQVHPNQFHQLQGNSFQKWLPKLTRLVTQMTLALNDAPSSWMDGITVSFVSFLDRALLVLTRSRRLSVWRTSIWKMESYNFLCMSSLGNFSRHHGGFKFL